MKQYVKPQFEYVALLSEERFAVASSGCTLYGTCPVNCDTVNGFDINNHPYTLTVNFHNP